MMANLKKLQQWLLYTPLGRDVLRNERIFYHNSVHNIFGYYSLQVGLPQINFLQGNKIPHHYILTHDIKCDLNFLPFANNSIDLIVCPHVLEYTANYYYFLQECHRILIPEGKLIITSFNKNSLFNLFKHRASITATANLISLETLKKELYELNFRIDGGKFFGYRPPINNTKFLSYLAWLDKFGDRWLPTLANNYALIAVKEQLSPTVIDRIPNTYPEQLSPELGTAKICSNHK
ncbi:MAG: class I SAM-dependent methyltransferase [Burkholderiales bacterium]